MTFIALIGAILTMTFAPIIALLSAYNPDEQDTYIVLLFLVMFGEVSCIVMLAVL